MRRPVHPPAKYLEALYVEAHDAWTAIGHELQLSVDRPTAVCSSYVLWWTANRYHRGRRTSWYGGVIVIGPYQLPLHLMPVYLAKILDRALSVAKLATQRR